MRATLEYVYFNHYKMSGIAPDEKPNSTRYSKFWEHFMILTWFEEEQSQEKREQSEQELVG